MSRALPCLVAVLFLAPVRSAPGQTRPSQPARDTPVATGGTASIRGRVVDATTGRALSRVELSAGPNAGQVNGRIVMTDGEGRYEISGLPAGVYTIIAAKPNYVRTSWGEQRPEGPGKRITIADGEKLDNINLSLKRSAVVTGKVVDEFGDAVTDVFVTAMRYQYVQGSRRLMPNGRSGGTNDIGEFRIYGLSPGQYYISATLRNFDFGNTETSNRAGYAATFYPGTGNVAEAQRLTVAPGQTVTGINLTLLPIQTAKISGTATDAQGIVQRVGGSMMSNMGSPVRPDGKFTINGLTPGDYVLRFVRDERRRRRQHRDRRQRAATSTTSSSWPRSRQSSAAASCSPRAPRPPLRPSRRRSTWEPCAIGRSDKRRAARRGSRRTGRSRSRCHPVTC